jgi:YidC/Oxa1 family membrane protein insertase
MAVMILTFFALNYYKTKYDPQTASPNSAAAKQSAANSTAQAAAQQPAPTVAASVAGQTIQVPVIAAETEAKTVVENELYRITFSNRGAQVTSWILKRYKDSYGKPLDLVHTEAAATYGYPLSLYTYDAGLTANLAKVLYKPSATGNLAAPATLTFKYAAGEYSITKTFSFDSTYVLHADTQVLHNGVPVRALLAWPGGFGDQENALSYASAQVDYDQDAKVKHVAYKDVSGGATLNGGLGWAGVSDLYFASVFLPDDPADSTMATLRDEIIVPKDDRHNGLGPGSPQNMHREPGKDEVKVPIVGAAVGNLDNHNRVRIFTGPKAVGVLQNIYTANHSASLEPLLDFGFWGGIGKYLFLALRYLNEHVATNWGWDIVLLTLIVNACILPLRIMTMQSALKMQRIQPQIEAIKAKYKNPKMSDTEQFNAMNAEVMQFQKDAGVNMFGGCLPTLIQMPLLFAFLYMLPKVVELRQAHFLWLPDLSSADPWHILPIFMGVSMFLVQFYTPSPGIDPAQQKMMAFMMPIFSMSMTWKYASGLALYWSVGNVISIATQAIMNQTSLGREMREIAAKRARRKLGQPAAKTIQGKPRPAGVSPKQVPRKSGR